MLLKICQSLFCKIGNNKTHMEECLGTTVHVCHKTELTSFDVKKLLSHEASKRRAENTSWNGLLTQAT